ncbi:hypothetical protein [Nostoc sp.]
MKRLVAALPDNFSTKKISYMESRNLFKEVEFSGMVSGSVVISQ